MKKDTALRSHAQNKFLRRIGNKGGALNMEQVGVKGTPIPGTLTPTEIAHKARRRARRLAKAKMNASALPGRLESFQKELIRLEALPLPTDTKELQDHNYRIAHVKNVISELERQIAHSRRILAALA